MPATRPNLTQRQADWLACWRHIGSPPIPHRSFAGFRESDGEMEARIPTTDFRITLIGDYIDCDGYWEQVIEFVGYGQNFSAFLADLGRFHPTQDRQAIWVSMATPPDPNAIVAFMLAAIERMHLDAAIAHGDMTALLALVDLPNRGERIAQVEASLLAANLSTGFSASAKPARL
jgi:hypothetical protein